MSVKIMGAVWDSALPHNLKLVALAYADHANDAGYNVWPGVSTIAQKTGYNERQVQRITRELEKYGVLVADGTGRNNTRRWRVDTVALSGVKMSPPQNPGGDISDTQVVTFHPPPASEMSPDPSEPSVEPSMVVVVGADPGNPVDSKKKSRAHARAREATPARQSLSVPLAAAFDDAEVLDPGSRLAIVAAWPEIRPEDISAWAKQRYRHNLHQPPKRQMGVGAMVAAMMAGHRARDECYEDAESTYWNFIT